MTDHDYLLPIARKLINGLAAKPGIQIVDKTIAADNLAQALNGIIKRGELPEPPIQHALQIRSLRPIDADCACGRWVAIGFPGPDTRDQLIQRLIQRQFTHHRSQVRKQNVSQDATGS